MSRRERRLGPHGSTRIAAPRARRRNARARSNFDYASRLLAAALVCPLSLEIFQDPVIAADGHSYERREIELWFARGKTTSPKTNEELPNAFLVPNRHLKAMCQQFLDEVREVEEAGG